MEVHRRENERDEFAGFAVAENPPLIFREEYCRDCDDYNLKLCNERGAAIRDIVTATVRDSYG